MSMSVKLANVQRSIPGIGYQGDPGIFGFLGKVAKGVTGAVSRLGIPGISGIAGLATGALGGILGRKTAKPRQLVNAGRAVFAPRVMNGAPAPPTRFNPPFGGAPGAGFSVGGRRFGFAEGVAANGGPPGTGYHLNKSDYFLKDGTFIAKGSVWVKNRRRNPFNPRAIDRAIGRVSAAKRATARLGRITIRKVC